MLTKTSMIIKATIIFGVLTLLSCGQQAEKAAQSHPKPTARGDSSASTTDSTEESASPHQRELVEALSDVTIEEYYKEIYRQEKLIFAEDNKMLSITENLFIADPDKDLFYFVVFTKSMNGSDGFYSEAVGLSALKYVTEKTEQFADYFNIVPKLTEKDMDNWAQSVYGEILISRENQEENAVKDLEIQLLKNIEGARKEYKAIIEKFIERIKSTMFDGVVKS